MNETDVENRFEIVRALDHRERMNLAQRAEIRERQSDKNYSYFYSIVYQKHTNMFNTNDSCLGIPFTLHAFKKEKQFKWGQKRKIRQMEARNQNPEKTSLIFALKHCSQKQASLFF